MSAVLKLTRPKMRETDVQSAVLSLLRYHPKVAWAHRTNTGAMAIEDKGKRRFVRFGVPGWPDITGQMKPLHAGMAGAFLAVECKSSGGKLTDEQAAFLSTVNKHGGLGVVACGIGGIDDVADALRNFHG